MSRNRKFGLLLGGLAVAIVAFCLWPSQEPVYEGKRLGAWLDEGMTLSSNPFDTNRSFGHVTRAIQAIGTNAIPFLLRDLEYREAKRKAWLKQKGRKLGLVKATQMEGWRRMRASWGFVALGTNAAPALGRLLAIHDKEWAAGTGHALIGLGPVAVPGLVERLHSTNWQAQCNAASELMFIGPAAEPAIPSLMTLVEDTNPRVRQNAVAALMGVSRQPDLLVPLFRHLLKDSNAVVRAYAVGGLGRFGLSAQAAIPDLVQATNDPDPNVGSSARRALQQIASEASKSASR